MEYIIASIPLIFVGLSPDAFSYRRISALGVALYRAFMEDTFGAVWPPGSLAAVVISLSRVFQFRCRVSSRQRCRRHSLRVLSLGRTHLMACLCSSSGWAFILFGAEVPLQTWACFLPCAAADIRRQCSCLSSCFSPRELGLRPLFLLPRSRVFRLTYALHLHSGPIHPSVYRGRPGGAFL